MEKRKISGELHSRREFFKKAVQRALPIMAVLAMSSNPVVIKATGTMGCTDNMCTATCKGACKGTCRGCPHTCYDTCVDNCFNNCYGGCKGTCHTGCYGQCVTVCKE